MKTRILAGLVAVLLAVLMFTLPNTYFYILFITLAFICCHEFMHMLEKAGYLPMKAIAYVWTLLYIFLLYNNSHPLLWDSRGLGGHDFLMAITVLFMALLIGTVFSKGRRQDLRSFAFTFAGCIYTVML
ncbi:MAG: phosphatidate cytidylyltransferase, partial [Clostridia bacterium]|nr:phosphatidate cytidylyltransferase [Clostridia bacterium]